MKICVGVTDIDWYQSVKENKCDEVNFWKPSAKSGVALEPDTLFLFRLKKPYYAIAGGGFFVSYSVLPMLLAWDAFKEKNGVKSLSELREKIINYRKRNRSDIKDQNIGCIVLTDTFFFDREDWIPSPPDFSNNTVVSKYYDTSDFIGMKLYKDVQDRLADRHISAPLSPESRYSESLTKHRLGQGGFRVSVTNAYKGRCAITGEKTLVVLEAAHIKPYSQNGPHLVSNGILLKSDFHTLYDEGYITIDKDFRVDVSPRLHEDYGNGRDYYKYHGQKLIVLPSQTENLPATEYLQWHNENVFLG